MNRAKVGERLRALRGNRSMKEVSLATGISVPALSNYERGARNVNDRAKLVLARYYKQSVESIFFAD